MQKATELLLNIIEKEGVNSRRNHVMDFSKEEHQMWLYEMFGGKDHLEKEYPELYKLVEKTFSSAAANKTSDEDDDPLKDLVFVLDIEANYNYTGASGRASLKLPTKRLFESVTLVQNGKVIERNRDFFYGVEYADLKLEISSKKLPSREDTITFIFNAIWEDEANGILRAESSIREDITPRERDVIQDIIVTHPGYFYNADKTMADLTEIEENAKGEQPILEYTPSSDPRTTEENIRVSYNRGAIYKDILDYRYHEERDEKRNQHLFLDIRGKVILAEGYQYKELKDHNCVLDIIGNGSGGDGAVMSNAKVIDGVHVYGYKDENGKAGFKFALPTYWNASIPDSAIAATKEYYLDAEICFTCEKDDDRVHTMRISSTDGLLKDEAHFAKIPKLTLMWGCLQKGTKVRMAKEPEKEIQDIKVGDEVIGADGNTCKVVNITKGTEVKLCYIKVEGYPDEIGASFTHPFMTDKGVVEAGDICPNTLLKMDDGEFHKTVECYPAEYGSEVYNLVLEPSHWFYANGFCTGDNVVQGDHQDNDQNAFSLSIGPELIEEIEKLKQEFC